MVNTNEYAALSAHVYNNQRGGGGEGATENTLEVPPGWVDTAQLGFAVGDSLNAINPFSFTGGAYLNQATGEIEHRGQDRAPGSGLAFCPQAGNLPPWQDPFALNSRAPSIT